MYFNNLKMLILSLREKENYIELSRATSLKLAFKHSLLVEFQLIICPNFSE